MNEENLISLRERDSQERKEISKKGGIASGIARREKRTAREIATALLEGSVISENGEEISLKEATIRNLLSIAVAEKNLNAIKYLLELIGEAPVKQIEVTQTDAFTQEYKDWFAEQFGMNIENNLK